jgi:hypothetical protein
MNFPKFWAKAEVQGVAAWGWSNESVAQARILGEQIAGRLAARFARGDRRRLPRYEYGNRPLREEILREFRRDGSAPHGIITRNSYGCLVLNTPTLLFVDVDLGEESEGLLARLFARKAAEARVASRRLVLERAEEWARSHPGWGWRIYETRAGLRLVATHRTIAPEELVSNEVFDAMNADPLYRRLCTLQKCFRARLTPKPWRCDAGQVPARWPFAGERQASAFQAWEKRYLSKASQFATCRLVLATGNTSVPPDVAELVSVHDEITRVASNLPLA